MLNYKPDFLITPYEVHACENLRPSDSTVYAVVYWYEKMVNGKCTAGNGAIAEVARMEERTVRAALDRLEKNKFILRIYKDKDRKIRDEIKCLVHMTKVTAPPVMKVKTAKVENMSGMKPGDIVMVDGVEKIVESVGPTPGDIARDFFAKESLYRDKLLEEVAETTGAPKEAVLKEARDFYLYWTEPTKSGKKQLWETKATFEVKRRLYTWLQRSGKYNKQTKRTGAGITI